MYIFDTLCSFTYNTIFGWKFKCQFIHLHRSCCCRLINDKYMSKNNNLFLWETSVCQAWFLIKLLTYSYWPLITCFFNKLICKTLSFRNQYFAILKVEQDMKQVSSHNSCNKDGIHSKYVPFICKSATTSTPMSWVLLHITIICCDGLVLYKKLYNISIPRKFPH